VRASFHVPVHPPAPTRPFPTDPDEEDEERFTNRPCYEFNSELENGANDRHCSHCRHYLTARCPHIDEFLDDVEDLSPE